MQLRRGTFRVGRGAPESRAVSLHQLPKGGRKRLLGLCGLATVSVQFRRQVRHYGGRSFCPVCGSRLFHLSDEQAEINLSALDLAPGDLLRTREGWISAAKTGCRQFRMPCNSRETLIDVACVG